MASSEPYPTAKAEFGDDGDDAVVDDDGDESDGNLDSPERRAEAELLSGAHWDAGGESGYDTDPVDRFLKVSDWQRQLQSLQRKLKKPLVVRKFQEGQKKVVQQLRHRTEEKVKAFNLRMEKELAKVRVKKIRQMRHILCFMCTMTNFAVMMFWLGRWPHTFHWWYTANCVWLIGCRAVFYRWQNSHLFLLDLCYFVNGTLLAYIWFFPDSEWLLQGVCGFAGVLMISVPLFRNSFVPHSLDRITSFHIHIAPVIQIWVIRWPDTNQAANWPWRLPEQMSVAPALVLYLCWAIFYYTYLFVIQRRAIERHGHDTLYKHFTEHMGLEKALPKQLQGPLLTRLVFMVGHFLLFLSGILCGLLPYWIYTLCGCITAVWAFRNGARFYMTYFWRVYEDQITAFERERAKTEQQMQEHQRCKDACSEGEADDRSNHDDADDDMDS